MSAAITGLQNLHADNFVVYFKSQVYHFNVLGETFSQDHALLGELYDFLWEMHDTLGEQIRQLGAFPYSSLEEILSCTIIDESPKVDSNPETIYTDLTDDIDTLLTSAQKLYETTTKFGGYQTLMGDYIKSLSKLLWKIRAQQGTK